MHKQWIEHIELVRKKQRKRQQISHKISWFLSCVGQTKKVIVYRLVIRGSVEERILKRAL